MCWVEKARVKYKKEKGEGLDVYKPSHKNGKKLELKLKQKNSRFYKKG